MTEKSTQTDHFLRYINTILLMLVSALVFNILSEFKTLKQDVTNNIIETREMHQRLNALDDKLIQLKKQVEEK